MATQGATLPRRGMQVPIWLIAALVAIAVAATIMVIGMRARDDVRPAGAVTSVQGTEASGDGVSPRGATSDAVSEAKALDAWSARVHELPPGPFHEAGRAHEAEVYTRGIPR